MYRIGRCMIGMVAFLLWPLSAAQAAAPPDAMITRIQTGSTQSASDEVIEVLIVAARSQILTLEYKSATGKQWAKKATWEATAPAGTILRFASQQAGDAKLVSGLAQAGGNIRLKLGDEVVDQVAWGTGDTPEGSPALAPMPGQTLDRMCTTSCLDSQNNAADFVLGENTATGVDQVAEVPTVTTPSPTRNIIISEILPDPAAPQTDARDEFIELFNASSVPAELTGWKLMSGKQIYKLDEVVIPVGGFVALNSAVTKLGLANAGDVVSLINAEGDIVMSTPDYGKAQPGVSFGLAGDTWGWLEQPTPGAQNLGLRPATAAASAKKSAAKKASTKKTATGAKSTSARNVAAAVKDAAEFANHEQAATSHLSANWVLAILGLFGVGYALYEYRPEIFSYLSRLRAKFGSGAPAGNDTTPRRRR